MEKSPSENTNNSGKSVTRKYQRSGSSDILSIKRSMKQKAEQLEGNTDFVKDDYSVAQSAKDLVAKGTGIVYDEEMIQHYCFWDRNYPENPQRFTSILIRCEELKLLERCQRIQSRRATKEEILEVHGPKLVEVLEKSSQEENFENLEELSSQYDSVYFNKSTYGCAALAAGCCIELIDAICSDQVQNGMAIVRPPGHHAMKSECCGYCFFNNAALAANHALKKFGLNRILIIDWDVHHGQGTQRHFYDSPEVIYFSIHRYEHGTFWPELRESDFDYIGEKTGKGFNFNIPLNSTGHTDADYLAIFHQIILPVAYQFVPQLIIISAGYDAAIGCREGEMELTPAVYSHFIQALAGLAVGKLAVLLEGGYCLKSLAEGSALTLRALLGDPVPRLVEFGSPSDAIVETILNVITVQRPFWSALRYQEIYNASESAASDSSPEETNGKKHIFPADRTHMPKIYFKEPDGEKPSLYPTRDCYPPKPPESFVAQINSRLDRLTELTDLYCPPARVVIAYDETMLEHRSSVFINHPEKPERIEAIYKKHKEFNILERCALLPPRLAKKEELLLVHNESYVNEMEQLSKLSDYELSIKSKSYDSIYLHQKTYECAQRAAGSVLQIVDEVVLRRTRSGVGIVRPPGHHAEVNSACGFCIFNNASLAAKYALEEHGLKRVLLLDWDIHHGNGTQRIFEADNRVLYISLHRFNHGKFFPASTNANYNNCGVGKGEGYTINIPWNMPKGELHDGDYIAAFFSIILPIGYQFDPELIIVSAGFDACVHDPLGSCNLSPELFAHMTQWLTPLANGQIILCLEGGYNITATAYAMTLCTKVLLGDPPPFLVTVLTPSEEALETLRKVAMVHEKYWPCLRFNRILPEEGTFEIKVDPFILKEVKKDQGAMGLGPKKETEEAVNAVKPAENVNASSTSNSNYKPQDANENTKRNNSNRPPALNQTSENASGRESRPTLVEYLSENIQRLLNEEMYAVFPQTGCPHLADVQAVPPTGISVETPCSECATTAENWICLICYSVHCGRYVSRHMVAHNEESGHPLTLSFTDLSVWCYVCEAYIDNMVLYPAKNAVHRSKFGSDLAWSYGERNRPPAHRIIRRRIDNSLATRIRKKKLSKSVGKLKVAALSKEGIRQALFSGMVGALTSDSMFNKPFDKKNGPTKN